MTAIYGLKDPRDGQIRYVGRTRNLSSRIPAHRRNTRPTNKAVGLWVSELQKAGLDFELVLLEKVVLCCEAEAEEHWFEAVGRRNSLLNANMSFGFKNSLLGPDEREVKKHQELRRYGGVCPCVEGWLQSAS